MCGICGIFNLDGRPCDGKLVHLMNTQMIHRGPDGDGVFVENEIGLGHRRLSIIDLDAGHQPMGNADGSIQIVFNGEIYNFLQLKKELEAKGHRFRTRSDTESIIYAYEQWGEDFLERLRGMFAIALWDRRRKKLILARDRIGKKPLYYCHDGNRLVFASELKALMVLPGIQRRIDSQALDAFLSFGYVPSPLSIYSGIQKLPPAHMAVIGSQGMKVRRYWKLAIGPCVPTLSEDDWAEGLLAVFDEAVQMRLISDVPLGAFLSGGVDSSAVVAAMALAQPGDAVRTNSIGFSEKQFDEIAFSRIVAGRYNTDHTEFIVEHNAPDVLAKIAWHLDEPFADSSAIPTYYVSKMARQNVTVALSGDGGDETFAGYAQRYRMNQIEARFRGLIPKPLRAGIIGPLARIYPKSARLPRPLRLKNFLGNIAVSQEQAFCKDMTFYFDDAAKSRLIPELFTDRTPGLNPCRFLLKHFQEVRHQDAVTRVQYVDMMTYLPEDILVKVDRMSMANSLEVRAPLLDHKLMEYAARMPSSLKLRKATSKYIFKKINEQRLPREILHRKKQGFSIPLSVWLRQGMRPFAEGTLFSRDSKISTMFNMAYIKALWNGHQCGRQDNANPLWALMMFELWAKTSTQVHLTGKVV